MNEMYAYLLQKYAAAIIATVANSVIWTLQPASFSPAVLCLLYALLVGAYQWGAAAYGHALSPSAILALQGASLAFLPLIRFIEPRWREYNPDDGLPKMVAALKGWEKRVLLALLVLCFPWGIFSAGAVLVYVFSLAAFAFFTHYMRELDGVLQQQKKAPKG